MKTKTLQATASPSPIIDIAVSLLDALRARPVRVHAITNAAAQVFTANLLLAAGAIPSLTYARDEVEAFTARADALLVNLGTLDGERRAGILAAIETAHANAKPFILDPVFVDRSPPRLAWAKTLLMERPAILRCNAAEFEALSGAGAEADALKASAREWRCVIALTGETDIVTDGERVVRTANGHPLMTRVTAMGCAGTALAAAFAALEADAFVAAAAALVCLGAAGEVAAAKASGPGT
ncbi:MAG TPA: hydroxyethylthiazole kinase, partial [Saliniramus sp.]|nr:hydroxyethylthiazole kinase [Saliniramus sp.]